MTAKTTAVPLMPSVARQIIEESFQNQPLWKRGDLVTEVQNVHRVRGGAPGKQDAVAVVKKALQNLVEDGKVEKAHYGHWRWISGDVDAVNSSGIHSDDHPAVSDDEGEEGEDEALVPEKEIGDGLESVYLYYNPNDRKLARHEGRTVWECKIGKTGISNPISRILSQGVKTALSHTPVIGLVVKTNDSAALEKVLHNSLRLLESQVPDSGGDEWFMTSPQRVEAWYGAFQQSLPYLREDREPR